MKRLLVFTSTFPRWKNDTIPPFVYELSKRLTSDFEVHVLAPHFKGAKTYEIMDKMYVHRFKYLPEKYQTLASNEGIMPSLKKNKLNYLQVPFFLVAEYFALKKLVKQIKPHVIHAHWVIPQGYISHLVRKSTGVDYVVTSHGSDILGMKGFAGIKKATLKNAKAITVVSNSLKEEVSKISPKINIKVIPMGIDTKLFNPNKKDPSLKKKYNLSGPFLLFVGRLAPEKGISYLIEAMPHILKEKPKTKLMVIGKGTLEEELKKRVHELDIEDNVIFVGWIDNKDLPKYYATADVFVCPSLREGFGLTFVEAVSCGCFLVGTREGGIQDIIQENKNGLFIEKENAQDISLKLSKYFNKKSLSKNYSKNFDWEITKENMVEVLE